MPQKPLILAIALFFGLIAVLGYVFRDQLLPAVTIEVGRVVLLEQDSSDAVNTPSATGEMLFQASGWVEPDPWAVSLSVKVSGIVEEVFVKEGEPVTNGQVIATLDPLDMQLAFDVAEGNVTKFRAALNAQTNAFLSAGKQVDAARHTVDSVSARLISARETSERYSKSVPGVVSINDYIQAKQRVSELEADVLVAQSTQSAMGALALQEQAGVLLAEAALSVALKEREQAALALQRTIIHSAVDGIVMRRHVQPGDKRMLVSDIPYSATIAELYNPSNLQVRVDVPISEAGKMRVGQPARIFSALLPGITLTGRITRIVGQADLQRNTLQAKVEIDSPDRRLRPEVLCRVEFWSSPAQSPAAQRSSGGNSLWIPLSALSSDVATQDVWVVDPLTQRAHRRKIDLESLIKDEFRKVTQGVRANEMVVIKGRDSLSEGARVKVKSQ